MASSEPANEATRPRTTTSSGSGSGSSAQSSKSHIRAAVEWVSDIATDHRHTNWVILLLIAFDAVVSFFVVSKVPYTEIDWQTYMEQIRLVFEKHERDYSMITGPTGPLVYPAGHVIIYGLLSKLTAAGTNIRLAQWIFAALYLVGLTLALKVYQKAGCPPYLLPFLVLSRRLHSIFMLRLFNDAFVAIFSLGAVLAYQNDRHVVGSLVLAMGILTKMSVLLVLPAVGCFLLLLVGPSRTITQFLLILYLQVLVAYPFLTVSGTSYFSRAFDLSRQFEYKWTVNWRTVPETVFSDTRFAFGLLAVHALLLSAFILNRWILAPFNKALSDANNELIEREKLPPSKRANAFTALRLSLFDQTASTEGVMGPIQSMTSNVIAFRAHTFVPLSIFTSNIIGMLCARSLHYQFYAWLFWTTPFILWRFVSRLSPSPAAFWPLKMVFIGAIVGIQEWAWNVYPSTEMSSTVVVGILAVQVVAAWIGAGADFEIVKKKKKVSKKDN